MNARDRFTRLYSTPTTTPKRGNPYGRSPRPSATLVIAGLLVATGCGSSDAKGLASTGSADGTTPAGSGTTIGARPVYAAAMPEAISTFMKANSIPGSIVYIKSPQGDWRATFGTAEIGKMVPMTEDMHARIGSNTKTMTVTVILQLVQEGKLSLDDPISKFRSDVPNGDKITIAQLAEMRSGLYSYTSDPEFSATLDDDPKKAWTPDELLKIAFSHPPNFAPGAKFEYSNTNTVLLGVVIEKLTGMTARDAFQERIFEPLKMTNSSLPAAGDSSIPNPHPQGYQFGTNVETIDSYAVPPDKLAAALDGTLRPHNDTNANPSWAWTAGGAISTVDDLAVYVEALVGGGLLEPELQKARLDSVIPAIPNTPGIGYGLGMAQFGPFYGHDGQLPGFSSVMVYDPKSDVTVIVFVNLSAVPESGENAAVALFRAAIGPALSGGSVVPSGDPAGLDTTSRGR